MLKNQGIELGQLVGKVLADAVADAAPTVLQFQHGDGQPVQVEHQVRPPLVATLQRHFLGQREIVVLRLRPIDQMHRLGHPAGLDLDRHAVAQQLVHRLVVGVQRAVRGCRPRCAVCATRR